MKIDLLAFAAHPDDAELSASGTLIHHKILGKTTGVIDLTRGELGSRGSVELRKQEAEAASKIMGLDLRENLGMSDGFFEVNEENLRKVITAIRKYQPEIILGPALEDRHPDHGRAAQLISRATFLAGLAKIETEADGKKQSIWRAKAVYYYIQDKLLKPDIVVDITPYFDKKLEAIMAYSSQFYNPESKEPQTPISTKEFFEYVKAKSLTFGRSIQCMYGEGFNIERTPGVNSLFDLK